jgi:hypothetical protein
VAAVLLLVMPPRPRLEWRADRAVVATKRSLQEVLVHDCYRS